MYKDDRLTSLMDRRRDYLVVGAVSDWARVSLGFYTEALEVQGDVSIIPFCLWDFLILLLRTRPAHGSVMSASNVCVLREPLWRRSQ